MIEIFVDWQFVTLSLCPSHNILDMEALRINHPKLLRALACQNWGGINMSLQRSSTAVMPLEGRAPCKKAGSATSGRHTKGKPMTAIQVYVKTFEGHTSTTHSHRPHKEPFFGKNISPQLPPSRCLRKGTLWRSLGFLGGLVQCSSVGLQPSWGRHLSSTSNLARGNGEWSLLWWAILLMLLFLSLEVFCSCDWCGCGTADAICAQLAKRLLLMGNLVIIMLACFFWAAIPWEVSRWSPLCWNFFCYSRCDKQGDWIQNHPAGSPNDLWVSWQRFGIGWDGGGWAMTCKANKQMHLEYTCFWPEVLILILIDSNHRSGHCFHSMIDFRSSGRLAKLKLSDTKTPWELRMLRKFGIIEDDPNIFLPLRRMREDWLLRNIQTAAWSIMRRREIRSRRRTNNSNKKDDDKRDIKIKLFTAHVTTLHRGIWTRPNRCHDEAQDDLYRCCSWDVNFRRFLKTH